MISLLLYINQNKILSIILKKIVKKKMNLNTSHASIMTKASSFERNTILLIKLNE